MRPVYLDHAATTPVLPQVLEAMLPFLGEEYGNPSSVHASGRAARHALEEARAVIGDVLGVPPGGVRFTSGGTEADNTAVFGMAAQRDGALVTCATEHEAILRPVRHLAGDGRETRELPAHPDGSIDLDGLPALLAAPTALVTVMDANNETGALNPISEVAAACRQSGVPLHSDAVQTAGYLALTPDRLEADLITLSAHKLGGPVGIGALVIRDSWDCPPLLLGGRQERDRRAGTENVAAAVGFSMALRIADGERQERVQSIGGMRDALAEHLGRELGNRISITTPVERSVPHILHLMFPGPGSGSGSGSAMIDAEMLLLALDLEGIQASSGSACGSGAVEASHVVRAISRQQSPPPALRLSLGHTTRPSDIPRAADAICRVVRRLAGAES